MATAEAVQQGQGGRQELLGPLEAPRERLLVAACAVAVGDRPNGHPSFPVSPALTATSQHFSG
jgi:hypothetical protein